MESSTHQLKVADTSSPTKRLQARTKNNSPKKANTAQTANIEDTSAKCAGQHDQAANKGGSSPKKRSPQKKHTSPTKMPFGTDEPVTHRPVRSRTYTSPMKQMRHTQSSTVCLHWQKGRCLFGGDCLFSHEQGSDGGTATLETQASTGGRSQSIKPTARPVFFDSQACYRCGNPGHLSTDCADAATSQLNGEVGRILATDSTISLTDEDAFFASLEKANSQAFTDHQIQGKLSEMTIRRLLVHAFAVRQASQEAMKLAYRSGQGSDYEKANALEELAKEILNTPGISLDEETKERITEVATKPSE